MFWKGATVKRRLHKSRSEIKRAWNKWEPVRERKGQMEEQEAGLMGSVLRVPKERERGKHSATDMIVRPPIRGCLIIVIR